MASMIAVTGSSIACRTSPSVIWIVFGSPETRSRPGISATSSSCIGYTEAMASLIASAVRSPSRSEYSFFT
ncbi:hypothetical protein HRbin12_01073 [bacterium HR12]|nr:hypothetical protein HRbin12_01073 [bacterium HR12]